MIATRFYTLADTARALKTNRQRVGKLIEACSITPERIGQALVMTAEQFAVIKAAHRRTPFGRAGRPPSGPSTN